MSVSNPPALRSWDDVTDEHGVVTDELIPLGLVYDAQTFRRWQLSLSLAFRVCGQPTDSLECRNLAVVVFGMDIPTDDPSVEESRLAHEIERLADGTFAPKGMGQVLRRGEHPKAKKRTKSATERLGALMSPGATNSPGIDGESNPFVGTEMERLRKQLETAGRPKPTKAALEILGGKDSTMARFAPGKAAGDSHSEDYDPARQVLHKQIVAHFLEGKTPELGTDGKRVMVPRAVLTAGGSASGKSTLIRNRADRAGNPLNLPDEAHTVHIDPDAIKEMLPEYAQLQAVDPPYAASAVHRESGDIAAELLKQAKAAGFHLIVDGTGNSTPGRFAQELTDLHDSGYGVEVVYSDRPTKDAEAQVVRRAIEKGRFVPLPTVVALYQSVSKNFIPVRDLPFLRSLLVYENGVLVAKRRDDGSMDILNPEAFETFINKAKEGTDGEA